MPKDSPKGRAQWIEVETPVVTEFEPVLIPQESTVASPLLTLNMSPFEGSVKRPLESIGKPSLFSRKLLLNKWYLS